MKRIMNQMSIATVNRWYRSQQAAYYHCEHGSVCWTSD